MSAFMHLDSAEKSLKLWEETGQGYLTDITRRLISDFLQTIELWHNKKIYLHDINILDYDRLRVSGADRSTHRFRKPKLAVKEFCTSHGTLAIDWKPYRFNNPEECDFKYMPNDAFYGSHEPKNRLIHVSNFAYANRLDESTIDAEKQTYISILSAGESIVKTVRHYLQQSFDVKTVSHFELMREGGSKNGPVLGFDIKEADNPELTLAF